MKPEEREEGAPPAVPTGSGLIRVTSRVGLWGLALAVVPQLTPGVPPSWLLTLRGLAPVFLGASGLGVISSSLLVLRALGGRRTPLTLAALAGVPFGTILVLGAAALLAPLSRFADLVDATGPIVLFLGVLVVVSLLIGFIVGAGNDQS